MTCDNSNFAEEDLKRLCAWAMGIKEFDEDTFTREVISITVLDGGDLEFHLIGCKTKVWKNMHINDIRHPDTCTDAFLNKIFCGKCGYVYNRIKNPGRTVWHCAATTHKEKCENTIKYKDFALRNISAFMLDLSQFDEQIFTDKIERITVGADGSLTYRFTDGKEKTWQRI